VTKIAGADNIPFGIILGGSERARFDADLAACTQRLAEDHDSIRPSGYGPDRTDLKASRPVAVPTVPGGEFHGPFSLRLYRFFLDDMDPILPGRKIVFLLAGNLTGKTAQAFVRIEEQRLLSHF
jgi:hypothetical protein